MNILYPKDNDPFRKIFPLSFKYEGGLIYENVAGDAGGPTKGGIALNSFVLPQLKADPSLLSLFDKNGDGKVDIKDIKALTYEDCVNIYYNFFWLPVRCDFIANNSPKKAFHVFDICLNMGRKAMVKIVQRALFDIGVMERKNLDYLYGPFTRTCIVNADEPDFCSAVNKRRIEYYKSIVTNKPINKKFLAGWLNRCRNVMKDMENL